MNKVIIYRADGGGVAVVSPSPEYLMEHTVEELAEKDVPQGGAFKIVDASTITSDSSLLDALTLA